jgi:ABC-type sulfate transport system substrate-binding protein
VPPSLNAASLLASAAAILKARTGCTTSGIVKPGDGGPHKQARLVTGGLDAGGRALAFRVEAWAGRARHMPADAPRRLPHIRSLRAPTGTSHFVARKGNPKATQNRGSLIKPGVTVITANPMGLGRTRPLSR